ncbi:hypothetical protein N7526_007975 [Penicillium atrosanguineum]|nr:hypothetical protein N7526_007975 [Penicillium atrosanguineum]
MAGRIRIAQMRESRVLGTRAGESRQSSASTSTSASGAPPLHAKQPEEGSEVMTITYEYGIQSVADGGADGFFDEDVVKTET